MIKCDCLTYALLMMLLETDVGFPVEEILAAGEEAVQALLALDDSNMDGMLAKADLCRYQNNARNRAACEGRLVPIASAKRLVSSFCSERVPF